MAGKKFTKGSEEWLFFQDFYMICQKFWEPENSEKYWEDVLNESNALANKYIDFPFARKVLGSFIESLEEKLEKG